MRVYMKKYNDKTKGVAVGISLAGVLICGMMLIHHYVQEYEKEKQIEGMRENYTSVVSQPTEEPIEEPVSEDATPQPTKEPAGVIIDGIEYPDFTDFEIPGKKIDFEGLQRNENEDIYAWIYIPNTNIDYPIVQHPDNPEYYLNRDLDGNSSTAGCIFTQYYNAKDFNDNNTVIYGHNMKNKSMFRTLHNYEDASFFEENPYVYIYTEYDTRIYQVFAEYEYSDKHIVLSYDFEDDDVFGEYLTEINNLSKAQYYNNYNWEMSVTQEDKIITLSTCIANRKEQRYLVQAKLIAVEAREDAVGDAVTDNE